MCVATLLGVAALLRAFAVLLIPSPLESDYLGYWAIANNLADGRGLANLAGEPTAFLSLGYPILLGAVLSFTGPEIAAAKALNLLLGLGAILLLHLAARALFRSIAAALCATALFAVYLEPVVYTAYVAKENLMIPLILVLVALASHAGGRGAAVPAWNPLLFGVAAGWLAMTGNAALALLPGLVLVILFATGSARATAGYLCVAALVAALTTAPLMWRNLNTFGGYALNNNGGFNLYIGNNPAATPYFQSIAETPMGAGWHALRMREGERGADRRLGAMALRHILDNPGATTALAVRKAIAFWEPPTHTGRNQTSRAEQLVRLAWLAQYVALCALAVASLAQWRRQGRALAALMVMLAGYTAVHMLFYVVYRYRLPIMPLVCLLGGVGLLAMQAQLRAGRGLAPVRRSRFTAAGAGGGPDGPGAAF
ncbi:hypothetical protein [Roseomonas sp. AR75]|uniref:hypothetical protein n=1 Tax=Roseomonas sp. AR75 TaxID=2562311 RepID=UPI0010C0D5AD|nr:hypothetical protein [Roseomonas sp. AR75]